MPGLCGILNGDDAPVAETLRRMCARMKHSASYRTSTTVTPCHTAGMGFVAIADVAERRRIASFDAGKFLAVVDGEILNVRELRAAGESADAGDAEFVLREYRRHGTAFIARLEGKFSAAIWDGDRRRLLLITDRFGMKPLFYRRRDKRLAFGAEAKTLFSSVLRPRTDVRSLAIFLSYGQLLEDRTLYQEVRVLPAAHILSIEADTGSSELQRYWRPEPTRRSPTIRADEILEQLDGAFQRSVDRATRDTNGLGISLSGGLDGRTMMAAIDHERIPITSLCSGMPGSLDHRCARKISELTNRRHDEHALDLGFLGNYDRYIKWMVHLTDGQYLDQGIVIPTLARYRELGIRVLLRGHAGEMLHMDKAYNFSVDESALAIRSQEELERWCLTRLQGFMLDGVETRLLCDLSLSEMRAISAESLRRCLSESDYLEHPLDRLTHLFLSQRSRRETATSLTIFGSTLETRVPYLDREIVEYVLSLPSSYRIGDRIQAALIRRRRPELLNVTNSNTNAPMQASKLRKRVGTLGMKVLAKFGVKGYEPYERLGLWLRRELNPLVRSVLLSDRCLDRGVFTPDTLRRIIERNDAGRKNFTYLILAMLIFELGQREFLDGEDVVETPETPPQDPTDASLLPIAKAAHVHGS